MEGTDCHKNVIPIAEKRGNSGTKNEKGRRKQFAQVILTHCKPSVGASSGKIWLG
jgi:hypothetical protein